MTPEQMIFKETQDYWKSLTHGTKRALLQSLNQPEIMAECSIEQMPAKVREIVISDYVLNYREQKAS